MRELLSLCCWVSLTLRCIFGNDMIGAGGVQVVAIGNAFELVHQQVGSYAGLSELASVDERHFGQKSTFWATRYGWPSVVVATSAPSESVLASTYADCRRPTFVEPRRSSSSICVDLLEDSISWKSFLSILDRRRAIFLAPYVHSVH